MRAIVWLAVAGCFPVGGGVQVGEEEVALDTPCIDHAQEVGFDEGVFDDGSSPASVLASLPLVAEVAPTWNDGGDATIAVDLAWDGGRIVYHTSEPKVEGASCPVPSIEVGLVGSVVSSDGALDEVLVVPPIRFAPDLGMPVNVYLPEDELGGTIDPRALVDDAIDGEFTASLEVLVHLFPGEASHGALVAMGCPVQEPVEGQPTEVCEPVEHDVAIW